MLVWFGGEDLPLGIFVYAKGYKEVYATNQIFDSYDYAFDPNDGLYATELAREFWKECPEHHPYASLFIRLYKKLEHIITIANT